jgi:NAD dependent epimerase/dehydratase family enzyme
MKDTVSHYIPLPDPLTSTAPQPLSNNLTMPPLVKLGALVLRTDPALGLTGRHATSQVLLEAGFEFAFPTLDSALSDLL